MIQLFFSGSMTRAAECTIEGIRFWAAEGGEAMWAALDGRR